jgi:hypothetical protein
VQLSLAFDFDYRVCIWLLLAAIPLGGVVAASAASENSGASTDSPAVEPAIKDSLAAKATVVGAVIAACAAVAAALITPLSGAFRPISNPQILNIGLDISVSAHRDDGRCNDIAVIDTVVTMKNISLERLVFIGSSYTIQGYTSKSRNTATQVQWHYGDELKTYDWSGRYEEPFTATAIEIGYEVVGAGDILEPGQEFKKNFQTPVPTKSLNAITGHVNIATGYDNRLRLGERLQSASDQEVSEAARGISKWKIDPTSWVASLTRGDQRLRIYYDLVEESGNPQRLDLDLEVVDGDIDEQQASQQAPQEPQELQSKSTTQDSERLRNFYGAAYSSGEATVALTPSPVEGCELG